MNENILFLIGLSFLIIHEMDAVRCKEWRILPLFSLLNDKNGFTVFLIAHIPLFTWIFYQTLYNSVHSGFIKGFDIFMIIHVGLHLLLLRHKNNEFRDWISWLFISGAGIFGLLDLIAQ